MVYINYFVDKPKELETYSIARKKNLRKVLGEYSIKKLTEKLNKNYDSYSYLCQFAHPYMYDEDCQLFNLEECTGILIRGLNEYNHVDFLPITRLNNEILVSTSLKIFSHLEKFIPEYAQKDINFRAMWNKIRELRLFKPKSSPGDAEYSKEYFK